MQDENDFQIPKFTNKELEKIDQIIKNDPYKIHIKKLVAIEHKITNDQLIKWLNRQITNGFQFSDDSKHVLFHSESSKNWNKERVIVNEAFTNRFEDIFINFYQAHKLGNGYHFVKPIQTSQYSMTKYLFAFIYKNKKYILEEVSGQGETLICLVDYKKDQETIDTIDGEIWNYSEIGNWVLLNDDLSISL